MIPSDFITEWRQFAPWSLDLQVEQDLILSRAVVELYGDPVVAKSLAFRGGTALYKLYLTPALRYSEDIDLVQTQPGPIGPTLDAVRAVLDRWLGEPKRSFSEGNVTLIYRVQSEGPPSVPLRVKVEINSREHFAVYGAVEHPFAVKSRWFSGKALVRTFSLDELLATKLRALYQRRKGRDLFDLWHALGREDVHPARIVEAFGRYLEHEGHRVSRAEFEENLLAKLDDARFGGDIKPLLAPDVPWDMKAAAELVQTRLVELLPGDPWKGNQKTKSVSAKGPRSPSKKK